MAGKWVLKVRPMLAVLLQQVFLKYRLLHDNFKCSAKWNLIQQNNKIKDESMKPFIDRQEIEGILENTVSTPER